MAAWEDVTASFRAAAAELEVGELVHTEGFSLAQAMQAVELMDPRMDAGMECHRSKNNVKSLDDALRLGLKVDGFSAAEIIGIADELVTQLASWLHGNALAQTVFTCLYLQRPSILGSPILKAICNGVLKIARNIREMAMRCQVHEEEDFQTSALGFSFAEDITDLRAEGMLHEAFELAEREQSFSPDARAALLHRLGFLEHLLSLLIKMVHPQASQKSLKLLGLLFKHADAVLATIELGAETVTDPAAVKPFEEHINAHLLAPTPPRAMEKLPRCDAYKFFQSEFSHLKGVCAIVGCGSLMALRDFLLDFSRQRPGYLSRCKAYTLLFPDRLILGRVEMKQLLLEAALEFNRPESLLPSGPVAEDETLAQSLALFLTRCAEVFTSLFRLCCLNRARQRRELAKFFPSLQLLASDAHFVDNRAHDVITRESQPTEIRDQAIASFVLYHTLDVSIRFMLLGIELQLYAPYELHSTYWYMDYQFNWLKATVERANRSANEAVAGAAAAAPSAASKKKGRKPKKRKPPRKIAMPAMWTCYVPIAAMAKAYILALGGFRNDGLIKPQDTRFASPQITFERRFAPLTVMDRPPVPGFDVYLKQTDVSARPELTSASLLSTAQQHFKQAAKAIGSLLEGSERPSRGTQTYLQDVAKVAKTNCVIISLCLAGHQQNKSLQLDFSVHPEFPVFRFV